MSKVKRNKSKSKTKKRTKKRRLTNSQGSLREKRSSDRRLLVRKKSNKEW